MSKEQRIRELKAMHDAMININDEEYYYRWIVLGVPDEPSEEDYESIAEDDDQFIDIWKFFSKLMWELANEYPDEHIELMKEYFNKTE